MSFEDWGDSVPVSSFARESRGRLNLSTKILDAISPPSPPPAGGFRDELPEAFAALDTDGNVMVIGYLGEWYQPVRPTLRVRLHNWLVDRKSKPNRL